MKTQAVITDHRTLRGMEIAGFIVRNGQSASRERHWTGMRVRICHVEAGPKLASWSRPFTYRGSEFRLKYFDGCFKPFVVRTDAVNLPSFV